MCFLDSPLSVSALIGHKPGTASGCLSHQFVSVSLCKHGPYFMSLAVQWKRGPDRTTCMSGCLVLNRPTPHHHYTPKLEEREAESSSLESPSEQPHPYQADPVGQWTVCVCVCYNRFFLIPSPQNQQKRLFQRYFTFLQRKLK